ncbi:MAG: retron system putative HNH endonuclease [Mariniphaga sp.]
MRFINKDRSSPLAFSGIVQQVIDTPDNSGYESLGRLRPMLLEYLIIEQHGLCAYCNQRITKETATVEHLICQSHNSNFDLNYHNLFAVCKGNEGVNQTSHCDKFRANSKKNDYFLPFILFEQCLTSSWNQTNPFFDVEFNRKSGVISGKIEAKQANVKGYPSVNSRITYAIDTLNLNTPVLVNARKSKWEMVLQTKQEKGIDWQSLFNYYLNSTSLTDFHEFVLLAIRKQEISK